MEHNYKKITIKEAMEIYMNHEFNPMDNKEHELFKFEIKKQNIISEDLIAEVIENLSR